MEPTYLPPGRVTTGLAALAVDVKPATIRDWVRRDLLQPCGGTPRRPIFRVADVYTASKARKPTRPGQRRDTHPA